MLTDGAALNRWRLILGENAGQQLSLNDGRLMRMDRALEFLYGREAGQDVRERDPQGGHEASQLTVAQWLNEVRVLFPQETAEVLQRHALDRYQLTELLTDREILEKMEPNQALLETVLSLKHMMKGPVLDAARRVVARVVAQLMEKMQNDVRRSALGKLDRTSRSSVRSLRNLDIQRTIRKNLAHYDRESRRLMLEQVYFNGRIKRYNPWRHAMSCLLWGMALMIIQFDFFYLNYLLPLLGCGLCYVGCRSLRSTGRWFRLPSPVRWKFRVRCFLAK